MASEPTTETGPDTRQVRALSWNVPWKGGHGQLAVTPELLSRQSVVTVDDNVVARFRRPTLRAPWVECEMPGSEPPLKLVQIAFPRSRYRTLIFVNGVSLTDLRSEADWRALAPKPMDDFEIGFGSSRYFGRWGAVLVGLAFGGPLMLASVLTLRPLFLAMGLVAFAIAAGWTALNIRLISWLVPRRSWPSVLRNLLVVSSYIGIPIPVALAAYALWGQ
jgi:hypothetical protein